MEQAVEKAEHNFEKLVGSDVRTVLAPIPLVRMWSRNRPSWQGELSISQGQVPCIRLRDLRFLKIVFRISATLVYVPIGVEPRLYHI
jgi:hypothetical protein